MKTVLERLTTNPKRIFLIDSLGALLTAFLLGVVLVKYNSVFGMLESVLYYLSAIAFLFSVYSISCHLLLKKHWKPYLTIIIIANLTYCLITLGLMVNYYQELTMLGMSYFIGEIIIIVALVIIEVKTKARLK